MLRITPIDTADGSRLLKVEGRVTGCVVGELSRTVLAAAAAGAVVLDLGHVTFVDQEGAHVLRQLRDTGVAVVDASEFVLAMMNGGKP